MLHALSAPTASLPEPLLGPALMSAALFGLFGTAHCAGMCGGIVASIGARRRVVPIQSSERGTGCGRAATPARAPDPALIVYNLGRLSSYTIAGAIAGGVGSAAWLAAHVLPVQQVAFVVTSLLLLAIGLHMAGVTAIGRGFERVGASLWPLLAPLARASLRAPGLRGALLTGLAWGWVPCGMVYGVLATALVSGSAVHGAALALAFGLGTLPGMLALGWAAQHSAAFTAKRVWARRLAGLMVIGFALAGLGRIDPLAPLLPLIELCVAPFR